uniref:UPAR/Ly6 domain-containing protein n=1 Tax=Cyprinus carpio carpio TaxID=630221 RepID=A0A9J8A3V0_CYPCA
MDLQISLFLLFFLFTAGHSLSCYTCTSQTCTQKIQCPYGLTNCFSAEFNVYVAPFTVRGCAPSVCSSGSINLGIGRGSSLCCNTDLCNDQKPPDPSTNALNGKKCYSCDGNTCSNTVSCSGSEDRCITATATIGVQPQVLKGCVSKSLCDATKLIPGVESASCCEGNLCNGVSSVTQSFLFLCCSLLFFILLH